MLRFLLSLVIGLVVGLGIGLFTGWEVAPVEYVNSPIQLLAPEHKEAYTLMVASGYIEDGDVNGAIDRLRLLGEPNVPAYVQELTERYITNSRNLNDIRVLVALSEGLGRLTPPMENFRQLSRNRGAS